MGGLDASLEAIAGGVPGSIGTGTAGADVEMSREILEALWTAGIDPWGEPPVGQELEEILISLPEGGTDWVTALDLPALLAAGATVLQIGETMMNGGPPPGEPTVSMPKKFPGTPEPPPPTDGAPPAPEPTHADRATFPDPDDPDVFHTLDILRQTGILGDAPMSWIDDLADIVGTVGDVLTTPIGTQGTLLSQAIGALQPGPTYVSGYAPRGMVNGVVPAAWDMPGVDVGRQGAISARGGPFFEGATKLRTRRILQFTHPETGRIVWYRNMGRPILWSGDRSTVRRWNRNVGPQRRVGVSRRRKR